MSPFAVTRTAAGALALAAVACARHTAPPAQQPAPVPAAAPAPVRAPAAAPAAPSPAPDLAGAWRYTATLGDMTVDGVLRLARSGSSYTGTASASTTSEVLTVTSVTLDGSKLTVIIDTPNGPATLAGTVVAGTIIGTVYVGEQSGPFRADKQ